VDFLCVILIDDLDVDLEAGNVKIGSVRLVFEVLKHQYSVSELRVNDLRTAVVPGLNSELAYLHAEHLPDFPHHLRQTLRVG